MIKDSSDPLDHARYEIFENTGVYVLYDYEPIDYQWNISSISGNLLTMQPDRNILLEGLGYLDKVFLRFYDNDFKKKYFPLKILLADQIEHSTASLPQDRICASGRSYIAIGRLRENVIPVTNAELKSVRGEIHGEFWGYRMYAHGLVTIPDSFFEVSLADAYKTDMSSQTGKDDPAFLYNLGFWSYDQMNAQSSYMTPDQTGDVADFVQMMTTHSEAEMKALMSAHPKLLLKYTILRNAVNVAFKIDLQQIGDTE